MRARGEGRRGAAGDAPARPRARGAATAGQRPGLSPLPPPPPPPSPGAFAAAPRAVLGPRVGPALPGRRAAWGLSRGCPRTPVPVGSRCRGPIGSVVPTPFPPAGLTLTGNGAGPPAGLQAGGSRAAGNECFARKAKGAAIFSRFCQSLPPLPSPGAALGTAGLSLVPPQRCRAVQPQCRGSAAPAPCSGCDPLRAARDPSIRLSIHVSICPSTPACSAAHPPSAEPRGSPDTGSAAEGAPHTSQRRREQRRAAAAPQHCRPTPYPGLHRAGHSPGCDPTPQNSPGCDPIPTAVRWPRSPPLMLRHKEKVFHGRLLSPKSLT